MTNREILKATNKLVRDALRRDPFAPDVELAKRLIHSMDPELREQWGKLVSVEFIEKRIRQELQRRKIMGRLKTLDKE